MSRERQLTEKGADYLSGTLNTQKDKLTRIHGKIDREVVNFGMSNEKEDLEAIRTNIIQLESDYQACLIELKQVLERNPGELSDATSTFIKEDESVVLLKVRSTLQKIDLVLHPPAPSQAGSVRSGRSRASSKASSSASRAKINAAKLKLQFAQKNAEIEKKEAELKSEKKILQRQEDLAVAIAEFHTMVEDEEESLLESSDKVEDVRSPTRAAGPPNLEPTGPQTNSKLKQGIENGPLTELAQYMIKKDLLMSRFISFNDKAESFPVWKASFESIITELNVTPREELDLLIRYLGPQSQRQAQSIHVANPNDPPQAIEKIWSRLDERYGRAEMVEAAIKAKLDKFPRISNDFARLYDLADIVGEIESLKENRQYGALFSHYDASTGVNQLLPKLPYRLQQKWIDRATTYKRKQGVPYPPFFVFATFLREMSAQFNDPSFSCIQASDSGPGSKRLADDRRRPARETIATRKTEVLKRDKGPSHCPIHKTDHSLRECRVFIAKSIEEKRNILRENRVCYKCCNSNDHQAKDCQSVIQCSVCGSNKHVGVMHLDRTHGGETQQVNTKCTQINGKDHGKSCAKIVPVKLYCANDPDNVVSCYAMIDEQSNRSLAKPELFSLLGIDGEEYEYTLNSCSGTCLASGRRADKCVVESLDGSFQVTLPSMIECSDVPNDKNEICTRENAERFPHLCKIAGNLPEMNTNAEILVLIGRDAPEVHHVHDQIVGPPGAPFAQKLGLGWVVVGELCLGRTHSQERINVYKTSLLDNGRAALFTPCENRFVVKEPKPDPIFERRADDDKPSYSIEDRAFVKIMAGQFSKDATDHWVAPLPFKSPRPRLPNNREQALKRAKLLDVSLQKKPSKKEHMVEFMHKVFSNGHAELAQELQPHEECWYLPIFGVYHPKNPNQIRGVFDSSAEFRGVSLNSVLLRGPDLCNSLLGILLRFRKDAVAVTADIEQMFYCFSVSEKDRNFLRFLWYKDNDPSKPLVEYRMCKHVFVNSPSPAIATYGLRKTVQYCDPDVKAYVENDFYVDDGLLSKPSAQEAVDIVKRTQEALKQNGLRLHKIASNDPAVMTCSPVQELGKQLTSIDLEKDELPSQRSLGLSWDLNGDVFTFSVESPGKPLTKRGVLSTINSVFDPIGFLAPVVIVGKLILRDVVSADCGWDDPLPADLKAMWVSWRGHLEDIRLVQIPRCYFGRSISEMQSVEMHIFSDASEKAISAVVYAVGCTEENERHVGFVIGKAKVAPSSGHTIPRLELCAAVLAVELFNIANENLNVEFSTVRFYSDSRIVLGYIHNQCRRFFTYVSNRVQKIRQFSAPNQWSYVPTELNPADVGSRGIDPSQMSSSRWLQGPAFLSRPEGSLPEYFPLHEPDKDKEVKRQVSVKSTHIESLDRLGTSRFERFSSWERLVSALSTLRHVVLSYRRKLSCKGWHACTQVNDVGFRKETEVLILKAVQSEAYQEEVSSLKVKGKLSRDSSILALDPFLDEGGLLRVGGRLSQSSLSVEEKHPVILPGKCHLSKLLVRHFHTSVRHQGRHLTEGAVRKAGFWITGGKRLVSSVIYQCVSCKKLRGQFAAQKMADLPVDRVKQTAPFSYVGVDVFGPWSVIARRTRGGQAASKRWAVLFTCLTIRAVHIEVIEEMSSPAFLNALRRFISVRGSVKQFRSDRGTNFVGAIDSLQVDAVNVEDDVTKKFLGKTGSVWLFNAPHSSHMGGSWERMIGIARRILDSMLTEVKVLTHDVLVTLMAEVAAIINARPIVPVSNDPENPAILTPSSLLTLKVMQDQQPLGDLDLKNLYKDQWRRVQVLADQFWLRWRREYLHRLQTRRKWNEEKKPVAVDDVVLLRDYEVNRNSWPLGRVTRVFPSKDGLIRKVEVCVVRNDKKSFYVRPVVELVPLVSSQ